MYRSDGSDYNNDNDDSDVTSDNIHECKFHDDNSIISMQHQDHYYVAAATATTSSKHAYSKSIRGNNLS